MSYMVQKEPFFLLVYYLSNYLYDEKKFIFFSFDEEILP